MSETITTSEMSEAEAESMLGKAEDPGNDGPVMSESFPEWATPHLPEALKIPVDIQITAIRVRADQTAARSKGDRVIFLWPLNEMEERQAVQRARGDQYGMTSELAKACIRAVDGAVADRTGTPGHPGNVSVLWREIGPKGRALVRAYYARTHSLTEEETSDFFMNCFATRISAPG